MNDTANARPIGEASTAATIMSRMMRWASFSAHSLFATSFWAARQARAPLYNTKKPLDTGKEG